MKLIIITRALRKHQHVINDFAYYTYVAGTAEY